MPHGTFLALALLGFVALPTVAAEPLRFNRDVRPILANACFGCHGPGKQKADLRLDQPLSKKDVGAEMVRRIVSTDADEVMPPADSHKALTAAQKETLKRWAAEGAVYEAHWSFTKLTKPTTHNSVDAFLDQQLAGAKLTANPEADRPTLIRRVSFALTGLPPTPKDIDAFLADKSADAYERMVDRYLASPQFGEEMARHWLDLARYADTHGLHLDNERGIWPYRDWVVRAFNDNKRFDVFTVEQLAGDLLPNPTKDQLIATGFNRCNVTTGEGGSIDAEWYFRNAVDRAAVATETWLGLTAGCAQCHDHKFDPISQKEFYSLYAFFYSADGSPLDGNALQHEPSVRLATPEQDRQLADLDRRLTALKAALFAAESRYADPGPAAAAIGSVLFDGADPRLSYRAWVDARGGADKAKLPKEIADIFAALPKPGQLPNAAQTKILRPYFLRAVCPITDAVLDPLTKSRDTLQAERTKLDQSIVRSMIFRDAPAPRQAFVMLRGQYNKPDAKVEPSTPAALPPLKAKGRANRLDFARWVVSPENPLTARVYVNRLWQQFFGMGLSKTGNDFGIQGEPPTHPELLDWLAVEFSNPSPTPPRNGEGLSSSPPLRFGEGAGGRGSAWDIKATVRLLVTSKAFRRSAKVTPEMLRADPENRLYARGPRFRLDAEQVRDNALFVSGLLNPAIGGKGVKPYQPENIWEPVAFTGSNTQFYKRDNGPALYRRSLYTFFKRTAPPPFLANFDAPNREQPCSRRDRSNTPLQALQLMNDVQHVEAARAFAERMLMEGGATEETRIAFAFKMVLGRTPSADELAIVKSELTTHLKRYAKAPEDAKKLIAVGETKPKPGLKADEVAAYTLVATMLLNLDETLTRN